MAVYTMCKDVFLVLFTGIVCIGLSVNAKPWDNPFESRSEILPGISTNMNVDKAFDVLSGKREINVKVGANGIVVEAGLSDEQKIIAGACILGALIIVPILCCLCCRACCRSPRPPTTIIYQRMPGEAGGRIPLTSSSTAAPPPYQKSTTQVYM